ncbi:MAG: DUF3857 domain-containing protein [Saprospiraceae bacterium]|nr:DUF3857 domain-containing protein [Saprospiraceae bacterium]
MHITDGVFTAFFLILVSVVYCQDPAIILSYHTNKYFKKGNLITEEEILLQINRPQADHLAEFQIYYQKGNDFKIVEALTLDKNGVILRNLKKGDMIDRSAFSKVSFYDDGLVKEFELKWHEYPYQVRLVYQHTRDDFLSLCNWYRFYYLEVPVQFARLTLSRPRNMIVRQQFDSTFTYFRDSTETEIIQTWSLNDVITNRHQTSAPPFLESIPAVHVIPRFFIYGIEGNQESWQSYGQWQWKMNEGKDELTAIEKRRIDQLLDGITDKVDQINKLYQYMQQNTRYISISMEIGGLQPHPASYVCENKYGDCKALTNYMQAALKYIGIPSYYVKVFLGENPRRIITDLPFQQFNHVILAVPVGKDTIWLENTSDIAPAGYLGVSTQNRWGLLIKDQESHLVRIPALSVEDVKNENNFEISLNTESKESGVIMSHLARASSFEYIQSVRNEVTAKNWQKYLIRQIPFENLTVIDFAFKDFSNQPMVELTTKANLQNHLRKVGNMWVASVPPITTFQWERPEDRYSDIRINYPTYIVDTIRYVVEDPEQMEIDAPDSYKLDSPFGHYHGEYRVENNTVILIREYLLLAGQYGLDQYPEFYRFTSQLSHHLNNLKIILKK